MTMSTEKQKLLEEASITHQEQLAISEQSRRVRKAIGEKTNKIRSLQHEIQASYTILPRPPEWISSTWTRSEPTPCPPLREDETRRRCPSTTFDLDANRNITYVHPNQDERAEGLRQTCPACGSSVEPLRNRWTELLALLTEKVWQWIKTFLARQLQQGLWLVGCILAALCKPFFWVAWCLYGACSWILVVLWVGIILLFLIRNICRPRMPFSRSTWSPSRVASPVLGIDLSRSFRDAHDTRIWDGILDMAGYLDGLGAGLRDNRNHVNLIKLELSYGSVEKESVELLRTLVTIESLLTAYSDELATYLTLIISVYSKIHILIKHTRNRLLAIANGPTQTEDVLREYVYNLNESIIYLNLPIDLTDKLVRDAAQLTSEIEIGIVQLGAMDREALETWAHELRAHNEDVKRYYIEMGTNKFRRWVRSWFQGQPEEPPAFTKPKPTPTNDLDVLKMLCVQAHGNALRAREYLVQRRAEFMAVRDMVKNRRLVNGNMDIGLHVEQLEVDIEAYGRRVILLKGRGQASD